MIWDWEFKLTEFQPEVDGGLKFLVKEVKEMHYIFSETKVPNSRSVTAELIGVFILHMQTFFLPFLFYLSFFYFYFFFESLAYP